MNKGPSYLGGTEPSNWKTLLGCGLLTVLGVAIAVILAYSLPHIICGNYGAGCPQP
ncbi:MAG: hypothetical protein ABI401_04235 [Candidatus Dormibacter sp.]